MRKDCLYQYPMITVCAPGETGRPSGNCLCVRGISTRQEKATKGDDNNPPHLQAADHSHEEEKRESEHIENPNSPNFPLLAICEEALAPPSAGTAASHSASALPLLFSPSWRSHKLLTSSLLTHSITILRSPSPRRDLGQRRSHITSVHTAVNAIDHKLSLDLFDAVLVVLQGDAHLPALPGHIQPHR